VGAIHDRTRYRRPPEEIYGADAYIERQQLPESLRPILAGFGMLPSTTRPRSVSAAVAMPVAPPLAARAPTVAPAVRAIPEPEISAVREVVQSVASIAPPVARVTKSAPGPASASAPASPEPGIAEKIKQAERLARIVVSDIVLYSREKFEAAVKAGNVLEAMRPEIAEGRSLFSARVDASIQEMRDFLAEEMLRVAADRGKG
jgi:hypothetical protein